MGWLIGLGILIVAGVALAGTNKKEGAVGLSVYDILFQSPAPISSSTAVMAMTMGFDPNGTVKMVVTPHGPQTVLTVQFRGDYTPPIPTVGQTFNFSGVPATVVAVNRAPIG